MYDIYKKNYKLQMRQLYGQTHIFEKVMVQRAYFTLPSVHRKPCLKPARKPFVSEEIAKASQAGITNITIR